MIAKDFKSSFLINNKYKNNYIQLTTHFIDLNKLNRKNAKGLDKAECVKIFL